MIQELKNLPPQKKFELIGDFNPQEALALAGNRDDNALWGCLVKVLKEDCLNAGSLDFPQALRSRLTQVATELEVLDGHDLDLTTDMDLAFLLTDFALFAGEEIDPDSDPFFRTKKESERQAARGASDARKALADAYRQDAPASGRLSDSQRKALAAMAAGGAAGAAATAGSSTAAAVGLSAAGGLATTGALGALGVAAGPLALVAGAAYMGARAARKRSNAKAEKATEEATRANRARKSKLVQNVVKLSVFVVAAQASSPSPGRASGSA